MQTRTGPQVAAPAWAAAALLLVVVAWRYGSILLGLGSDFVDFAALHGDQLLTEAADSRLNAWILAWVGRAAWLDPLGVLDTNGFYPALGTLTGSEHLFGIALQLAPLQPLLSSAVAQHQAALVLSGALLAATSFLAVRGWTGSLLAGLAAGLGALMMPWRLTEISHLQLSSVQWFPLIWWLLLRALYRDTAAGERWLLAAAIALQLLSSFYLAYFLTFSCAVLIALGFGEAARAGRLLRTLLALVPGYALFASSALPYLGRRHDADLAPGYDATFGIGLEREWSLIHPRLPEWLSGSPSPLLAPSAVYDVPLGILALGLIALAGWRAAATRTAGPRASRAEARSALIGLWGICLLGFVFALGGSLDAFGTRIPLPSQIFAAVLPGFEMLRGSVRWNILIGIAMPLLAGLGIAALEHHTRGAVRAATLAGAFAILVLSFDWFAIPTQPAWSSAEAARQRYAALAALPPGPVVEVPFTRPFQDPDIGSRALLASTWHWYPVVNGYTGYAPRSHALLLRIGARLPEREALVRFGQLAGARYFVVDHSQTSPREQSQWQRHVRSGLVTPRFSDETHRIYELRASSASGDGVAALRAELPGPTTAGGLPRTPLALASGEASFSPRVPQRWQAGIANPIRVDIDNRSRVAWAGLGIHREGLVGLRYTWRSAESPDPIATRLAPLDDDLPAGRSLSVSLALRAPLRSGPHRLCLDLVQQQDGRLRSLGAPVVETAVELTRPPGVGELHELIDAYSIPATRYAACPPNA